MHLVERASRWRQSGDDLEVRTDAGTDFWRETHYGFTHDSGHFFAAATHGDFTAELRVRGGYEALYDQAGLMVRLDPSRWVKGHRTVGRTSAPRRADGRTIRLGDGPYTGDPADFRLRVTVANGVLRLQASADGTRWPLVRLCPFPAADSYQVGPYG